MACSAPTVPSPTKQSHMAHLWETTADSQHTGRQSPFSRPQRWSWMAPLEDAIPAPGILDFSIFESHTTLGGCSENNADADTQTTARDLAQEATCSDNDRLSPKHWPSWYRSVVLAAVSYSTLVVIMVSTAYASGIPGMTKDFAITNTTLPVLGVSTYLFGLALGPLVLAPLSEMYGRRPVYLVAMLLFTILLIPSALAQDLATLLITRFFAACMGSVMVSNAGGTLNDIATPKTRALYFSIWTLGVANGPVMGPVLGGIVFQYLGWRWIHWIMVILAGISWVAMLFVQETFAPAILKKHSKNHQQPGNTHFSQYKEKIVNLGDLRDRLLTSMKRPAMMIIREPICLFLDIYIAILYSILYLCIVAYPIIYRDLRGWEPAVAGLPFLAIGSGVLLAILAEPLLSRFSRLIPLLQQIRHNTSSTSVDNPGPLSEPKQNLSSSPLSPEESNIPLVFFGSILIPLGQLPFALSASPPNSPVIAIMSGIPFGMGMTITFIYVSNYLAMCYGGPQGFAASALAGNASMRNIVGGGLPLLAPILYDRLGPLPTGLMLTGIETLLIAMPVLFWKYGLEMRTASKLATRVA